MAYDPKSMVAMGIGPFLSTAANTYTGYKQNVFYYATTDAKATVQAAGYFNSAAALLKVGDLINATFGVGGTIGFMSYIVTANTGSAVTVALQSVS